MVGSPHAGTGVAAAGWGLWIIGIIRSCIPTLPQLWGELGRFLFFATALNKSSSPQRLGLCCSLLRAVIFFLFTAVNEVIFETTKFALSIKRMVVFIFLGYVSCILIIWNHIGFMLDDLFFPDWKSQQVDRPLFIVGNARSGTTWTHRLVSLHDEYFTSMKTWEIFFAASVTWRKLFYGIYNLDRLLLRGKLLSWIIALEKRLYGGCTLHAVGLFEYEEDEWLMLHVFMSQLILLAFPSGGPILYPMVTFDEYAMHMIPALVRRNIIGYYKQCVQRHLFFHGKNKHFISKNPPFTMRLESLNEAFQDARFCCLIRDPVESVPSMVSYISHVSHLPRQP
jgi:hypothetical protein